MHQLTDLRIPRKQVPLLVELDQYRRLREQSATERRPMLEIVLESLQRDRLATWFHGDGCADSNV